MVKQVTEKDKRMWNQVVTHPLQSWEWGEFRRKTGVKVVREGGFSARGGPAFGWQLTIHKLPYTPWSIGYLPKGPLPTKQMIDELLKIGKENNCIFIQIEPNVEITQSSPPKAGPPLAEKLKTQNYISKLKSDGLLPSKRPLFTKYNFVIDLTKSEEELLAAMHPKTRYNIRVAQRHGVKIEERKDNKAFKIYLKLFFETIKRQRYFGHTPEYHRLLWQTLKAQKSDDALTAHLLIAYYTPPSALRSTPLVAWVILKFGDTIYYPYGGSSEKYKNVMASNLVMWEAIRLGKHLGAKKFDLWGALGPNPNPKDPWYGFHRFKAGYGGKFVEYVGSYDLILNPFLYWAFHLIDRLRWMFLRVGAVL